MSYLTLPIDKQPATLPTAAQSETIIKNAMSASTYTTSRRIVEAARKPAFKLAGWEAKYVPTVQRLMIDATYEDAFAEVFSAYYIGLNLSVACATSQIESNCTNIYGADPASYWMNEGPYGYLWNRQVNYSNFQWFIDRVSWGNASNGVGPKQLTYPPLIYSADARGGAWVPQHNCAQGDVFFISLLNEVGGSLWLAAYHYNGAGPAATNYANYYAGVVQRWRDNGIP